MIDYNNCIRCASCSDYGMIDEERMANLCEHCKVGVGYEQYKYTFQYKKTKYKGVTYKWWNEYDKKVSYGVCIYMLYNNKWLECFHTTYSSHFYTKEEMKESVKSTEKLLEKIGQSATTDRK